MAFRVRRHGDEAEDQEEGGQRGRSASGSGSVKELDG